MMAGMGEDAALQARVRELEAENARLTVAAEVADAAERARPRRRAGVWRSVVSAVCIVLASLLTVVAVGGAWARVELVDPDRFVATFGPLVEEPAVQALIIDEASDAILDRLDLDALVGSVFDGLAGLDLPPAAVTGLDVLRAPAVQGAQTLVRQTVTTAVESPAFSDVWATALRASHRALLAAATGDDSGAITIDGQGVIGLQLGPIIADVKVRLVDNGFAFAAAIPEIDRTIVLAQSDALVTVRLAYGIVVAVGYWLPFVALALFAAGVIAARHRRVAVLGSGVGIAIAGITLVTGIGVGAVFAAASAAQLDLPPAAVDAVYRQVLGDVRQSAIVLAVLGVAVALLCALLGPSRPATAVRRATAGINTASRTALRGYGMDTGRFGAWMQRWRVLVRVLIGVGAFAWLYACNPLGVGDVVLVAVVALALWWIAELLRTPATAEAPDHAS